MKLKTLLAALIILCSGWQQPATPRTMIQNERATRVRQQPLRVENAVDIIKRLGVSFPTVNLLLKKNTDGTTGYYLKQVGGPVLIANNENFVFYPASTIKVIEHLHVMRGVLSGFTSLKSNLDIWDNSCSDNHKGELPVAKETLSTALSLMMKQSNNQRTNAIQDRSGRAAINNTAHQAAGMSQSSAINHKFGCGGPTNNPANSLTLADAGLLYEGVANGKLLSGTSRETFYQLMLNETDAFFIEYIIDEEASKIGLPAVERNKFKSQVKIAAKAGGIPADYDGFLYESVAGYVSLPFLPDCKKPRRAGAVARTEHRGFVYGVFINKATKINGGTTGTAASELFRDQIREALKTWKDCPSLN
ncbi:MAG TPA: serine hydrolase [Pyrinomonadaceae bacterium]|jgi:hypothetical protein|nr:serine hydrolase [Pyrinomonadaceae bacterium]